MDGLSVGGAGKIGWTLGGLGVSWVLGDNP